MNKNELQKMYQEIVLKTNGGIDDYVVALCQIGNAIGELDNPQQQIADLQHRLDVAEIATKLACDYLVPVDDNNDELHKLVKDIFDGDKYLKTKINYFKEQAEREVKAEAETNKRSGNDE